MTAAAAHVEPVMRDCPAGGCDTRIARELVMCHVHWALVPGDLRQRIRAAARGGPASPMYVAAVDQAVQLVDAIEERRPA